jgi:hypothetical protein
MKDYLVKWWITFWDHEPNIHYLVDEKFLADSLEELMDELNEGIEEDRFSPEDQIPNNWDLGNLNIEYGLIYDDGGNEVYRDQDFNDELVPEENRISEI